MSHDTVVDLLPRYHQVRLAVERYLAKLEVGSQIMTEGELITEFGISRVTARRALKSLRDDGILESIPGRGTFLARKLEITLPAETATKRLGLLLPTSSTDNFQAITRGIEARARARDYQLVLAYDDGKPELQIQQIKKMAESGISGLLIYPDHNVSEMSDFIGMLSDLAKANYPLVLINQYIGGIDFPAVMTDNVRGMYEATEHMILMGRRRLALLGFWASNVVHAQRKMGFQNALADYGINTKHVLTAETSDRQMDEAAHTAVLGWIKGRKPGELPFDGIVCMHDPMAYGAFAALRENGFSVPEDVALIGYDNYDSYANIDSGIYKSLDLHLTSVAQPLTQMGDSAADMLINIIEKAPRTTRSSHILLPPKLIIRTSCGEKESANSTQKIPLSETVNAEK